jgi:hypothetical protein
MGLLSRVLRREQPARAKTLALEMPMLADLNAPDPTAVLSDLHAHWPDVPVTGEPETEKAATTVEIPDGAIGFVHMEMPLPAREVEGPASVAWHWPEARGAVAAHQSHVIATSFSTTLTALDLRVLLTKLVASILATTNSVGVYVGDARLVRSAADYRNDAATATRDAPPLLSWLGFNPVIEDGGSSAYTTGLTWFGLRELEVRRSARPVPEVLGMLADLAQYELTTGRVLRDGDTFGASAADRTRVRFRHSEFIPETEVAVLELP